MSLVLLAVYCNVNVFQDIAVQDPGFCQFKTLEDYLPEGCQVYMLGWPHYGCQGEVLDTDVQSGRVRINLSILEEPDLASVIKCQEVGHKEN